MWCFRNVAHSSAVTRAESIRKLARQPRERRVLIVSRGPHQRNFVARHVEWQWTHRETERIAPHAADELRHCHDRRRALHDEWTRREVRTRKHDLALQSLQLEPLIDEA